MGPSFEICIVSFDSSLDIGRAIRSVATHVRGASVAVREHGPTRTGLAAAEDAARATGLAVRMEADSSNPGFGAGCNALAAGSKADWLVFLNPDAEILAWPWNENAPPASSITGATLVGHGPSPRHYGTSYSIQDEVSRSWFRRVGREPRGRGFVSGAAMLVSRADFESTGGFDPAYFMFYEDIEFCLRANELGLATTVEPRWQVYHEGGHSTTPRFADSLLWSFRSAVRFHASRHESVRLYRLYVIADSALRVVASLLRRDTPRARAYLRLARVAATGRTE